MEGAHQRVHRDHAGYGWRIAGGRAEHVRRSAENAGKKRHDGEGRRRRQGQNVGRAEGGGVAARVAARAAIGGRRQVQTAGVAQHWRSAPAVLVVSAPPDTGLVAPQRGTVEPLIHAPYAVQSARIAGIAMVDVAVVEHEGT